MGMIPSFVDIVTEIESSATKGVLGNSTLAQLLQSAEAEIPELQEYVENNPSTAPGAVALVAGAILIGGLVATALLPEAAIALTAADIAGSSTMVAVGTQIGTLLLDAGFITDAGVASIIGQGIVNFVSDTIVGLLKGVFAGSVTTLVENALSGLDQYDQSIAQPFGASVVSSDMSSSSPLTFTPNSFSAAQNYLLITQIGTDTHVTTLGVATITGSEVANHAAPRILQADNTGTNANSLIISTNGDTLLTLDVGAWSAVTDSGTQLSATLLGSSEQTAGALTINLQNDQGSWTTENGQSLLSISGSSFFEVNGDGGAVSVGIGLAQTISSQTTVDETVTENTDGSLSFNDALGKEFSNYVPGQLTGGSVVVKGGIVSAYNSVGQIENSTQDITLGGGNYGILDKSYQYFTALTPPGTPGEGLAINNDGEIVGSQGFLYDDNQYYSIIDPNSDPGYTVATGINDSGTVIGHYTPDTFVVDGFEETDDNFSPIGTVLTSGEAGVGTYPIGINNAGDVVGEIVGNFGPAGSPENAFLLTSGGLSTFAFPGAVSTQAVGINNTGEIIGNYSDTSYVPYNTQGFTLINGIFTTVDVPGATDTDLSGLNDEGQIVGSYEDGSGIWHGFIYSNGEYQTVDIPSNLAPNDGIYGTFLTGINNSGVAVGWARVLQNSGQSAIDFVMNPSPSPNDTFYQSTDTAIQVAAAGTVDLRTQTAALAGSAVDIDLSAGDNTIYFGGAQESVFASTGSNTYNFSSGDGSDLIQNGAAGNTGASGTLDFGTGISIGQLSLTQNGENLVVSVAGSSDEVTVQNWFSNSYDQLNAIEATNMPRLTNSNGSVTLFDSVAQIAADQATFSDADITIDDTAANIAAALNSLNDDSEITGIDITDNLPVTVSTGELASDGRAIGLLENANGTPAVLLVQGPPDTDTNDVNNDGKSDLLLQNVSGAVVVGEVADGQANFAQVGALGSEWIFKGTGDYLGNGEAQILLQNTSGAVVVGEVGSNSQLTYTQVSALGAGWIFEGSGDLFGDGKDQFLLENTDGAVVVGEVGANDQTTYTQVGALGSGWTFEGVGDFLDDGKDQFLIQNASGAVVIGEVGSNDQTAYTQVSALGVGWVFEGTGDFLGDGRSDVLIENASAGAVVVGEVESGQLSYTQVGALGPQWVFEGVGDYSGTGTDSFLMQNSATGALVTGTVVSGEAQYSQIGALGPGWSFPTSPMAQAAPVADSLLGDGLSDILIENSAGAVVVGELSDGQESYTQVSALGAGWTFEGIGDYLGDGRDQYLLQNSSGAVVVGEVQGGQTVYSQVSALGAGWTFEGTGDYLDDGRDQYLLENSSGAVVVGEVQSGQTAYTQVSALGAGWTFEESGDFFGDGRSQFLIENSPGALDVGEVFGGQTTYTQVGALGPDWAFEGAGDFLGDGKDQILIENSSGALVLGEVGSDDQESYTQIGALGSEWAFVGVGDYAATGTDSFLIENTTTGALVTGTVVSGQAQYAQIGALGSTWRFQG